MGRTSPYMHSELGLFTGIALKAGHDKNVKFFFFLQIRPLSPRLPRK